MESYRQLKAEDDWEHAEAVKQEMPCVIIAGICEGGHSKQNFRTFSGYLMLDIDHYLGDIRVLLMQLEAQPWCYAGKVSISGEGAKGVIWVDAVS